MLSIPINCPFKVAGMERLEWLAFYLEVRTPNSY
jgi:hypothetical protein